MFRIQKKKRVSPQRMSDYLVWASFAGPGVIEQKDGLLQTTLQYRGLDLDSESPEGLVGVSARMNNALKRMGGGWSLFIEAQRRKASGVQATTWANAVCELVEEERREAYREEGAHFESVYFLTLCYAPPAKAESKMQQFFQVGSKDLGSSQEKLSYFEDRVDAFLGLFAGAVEEVRRLDDNETLSYLYSTVANRVQPVVCPDVPMYLDAILGRQEVEVGTELKVNGRFVRTLTINAFPSSTMPGLLDELNRLRMSYRWTTRFMAYDKTRAVKELKKYQKMWYRQRKGLSSVLSEVIGGGQSEMVNEDALQKAEDVGQALGVVQGDYVSFGLMTTVITVTGSTQKLAASRLKAIQSVVESRGFTTMPETFGTFEAWLSTHPGNVYRCIRRPLIHSLNLAHMMPMSAVWSGKENTHLGGGAHIVAKTTGGTPFRLSTNVGDVGHTLILGPTGAGKSTLLCLMMLQWMRYENAQVVVFDKGRSARAACLAAGGVFHELEIGGQEVAFQPLARVDEESERAFAARWVEEILTLEGLEIGPSERKQIWVSLGEGGVAGMPAEQRTMFALQSVIQDVRMREALSRYTQGGQFGSLFDSGHEELAETNFAVFEMERLMETPAAMPAVLSYLFHRLEQRFDGRPTLLVLDEAWMMLDHPMFAAKIREWLKVLRKKRVYVVFATQSVADAARSSIAPVLLESCLSRIFLPNGRALEPETAAHYKALGLTRRHMEILSQAQAKREYYFQSGEGSRLFELGLGPVALALCGASAPDDHKAMDRILETSEGQEFAARWLEHRGLYDAASRVRPAQDLLKTAKWDPDLEKTLVDDGIAYRMGA